MLGYFTSFKERAKLSLIFVFVFIYSLNLSAIIRYSEVLLSASILYLAIFSNKNINNSAFPILVVTCNTVSLW